MFGFAQPAILLLLVIPIVMGFWTWTRKGHPIIMPFDHGHQGGGKVWFALINILQMLPPIIVAAVICIWANPQKNDVPQSEREMTNIQILLDCSGSMTMKFGNKLSGNGFPYNRFDASKDAIQDFLKYRKGDAFGLSGFSDTVLHWVPLTQGLETVSSSIEFLRPKSPGRGENGQNLPGMGRGTSTGKALLACIPELKKRKTGDRMIILVSDGDPGDLTGATAAIDTAAKLSAENIVVHGVYISELPPKPSFYNVVQGTGGKVFAAGDPDTLSQVFKEIDKLQKTKIKEKDPLARDDFYIFSLVGLIAVFLHILASYKLRYTPW